MALIVSTARATPRPCATTSKGCRHGAAALTGMEAATPSRRHHRGQVGAAFPRL